MSVYVVSDVHGMYDEFIKMIELIEFNNSDILYILGDIIDRGPDSFKLYEYVKRTPNIKLLLGNHEKMMINYYRNQDLLWLVNGGFETLNSIYPYDEHDKCDEMVKYFESLSLFEIINISDQNYLLVHAGVNFNRFLEEQTEDDLLWIRNQFLSRYNCETFDGSSIVIHGHTLNRYIRRKYSFLNQNKDNIIFSKNIISLDGGCFFNGQLNCLRLDDLKTFVVKSN